MHDNIFNSMKVSVMSVSGRIVHDAVGL